MHPSDEAMARARNQWTWRGQARPPFAAAPGPEQESVWDFPRPPALLRDEREVVLRWGGVELARSRALLAASKVKPRVA